jgi:hypothetical protein
MSKDPRIRRLQTSGVGRWLQRVDYEAKSFLGPHPRVALPVARVRGHGTMVSGETDLLIEGFPRSANSFAVAAFELANGPDVHVAHHIHASAHVMAAAKAGIPALVLVRQPSESVLEMVLARPACSVGQALRGWIRFYRSLLPFRDRFVVGEFSQVTNDFGGAIARVNQRFGTSFVEFEHTDANVAACFEALDRYWRARLGSGLFLELVVGRPSRMRDRLKESLRPRYQEKRLATKVGQAEALFESFRDLANHP